MLKIGLFLANFAEQMFKEESIKKQIRERKRWSKNVVGFVPDVDNCLKSVLFDNENQ
jgi:hypothetical protein